MQIKIRFDHTRFSQSFFFFLTAEVFEKLFLSRAAVLLSFDPNTVIILYRLRIRFDIIKYLNRRTGDNFP